MIKKLIITLLLLLPIITADFSDTKCTKSGWSCLNCYQKKLCIGSTLWQNSTCLNPITNNQLPYCDPAVGDCVSTEPKGCKSVTKFECIRNDIFPDVQNCSRYFNCNDAVVKTFTCKDTEIYKSTWEKCIFRVSEADCKPVTCSLSTSITLHQDDPSLYYQCKNTEPTLKGCKLNTEVFNLASKTCTSICNAGTLGLFANTRDCTTYYNCTKTADKYNLQKLKCANGLGFNSVSKQCEKKYDAICNELAILDKDIDLVAAKLPLMPQIVHITRWIFKLFKFNPLTLLMSFGVSPTKISTGILITDYVVKNKRIPPAVLRNLINKFVKLLPDKIEKIVQMILSFIPMLNKSARSNQLIPVDYERLLETMHEKKLSDLIDGASDYINNVLEIPHERLMLAMKILQQNAHVFVDFINSEFGIDVLKIGHGVMIIDGNNMILLLQEIGNETLVKLVEHNPFMVELLRSYFSKYQDQMYEKLVLFFDNIYINIE